MEKLNMANMNTLFRKGYLLAGVMIAANMFVVNEMKATTQENNDNNTIKSKNYINLKEETVYQTNNTVEENIDNNNLYVKNVHSDDNITYKKKQAKQSFFGSLLLKENTINLIGGLAFSFANNYFKWWNYDAGIYREFGCLG